MTHPTSTTLIAYLRIWAAFSCIELVRISQIENEMFRTSDELYLSMLYILITFLFYCTKCATIPFIAYLRIWAAFSCIELVRISQWRT